MKKVLLVQLPTPQLFSDTDYFPLGLLFLHSFLERNGVPVSLLDLTGCSVDGVDGDDFDIPQADVYGITCSVVHDGLLRKLAEHIRRRHPDSLIIAGGAHAMTLPSHVLHTTAVDAVCTGDGEYPLLGIARGERLRDIPGILPKGGDAAGAQPSLVEDIDALPFPAYHILDTGKYGCVVSYDDVTVRGGTLITSRGCPFTCSFCASPAITRRKFRLHGVEYVRETARSVIEEGGYEGLLFVDDILTINKERLAGICTELKKLHVPWSALARVDCIDEEMLRMMRSAGCVQLSVGIESASAEILRKMRKRITPDQQAAALLAAHRAGLPVKACFIVGFPGETETTIRQTKEFVKRYVVGLGFYGTFNTFVPLPGSDVFRNPGQYGIEIEQDTPFDDYFIVGASGIGGYYQRTNGETVKRWTAELQELAGPRLTFNKMQGRAAGAQ